MVTKKKITIAIACEDCEARIEKGETAIEVNEVEIICLKCGARRRDEWMAFFESTTCTPVDK